MSPFKASHKRKYKICYVQPEQPDKVKFYCDCIDEKSAIDKVLRMKIDPAFQGCDIRIREHVEKVNWMQIGEIIPMREGECSQS